MPAIKEKQNYKVQAVDFSFCYGKTQALISLNLAVKPNSLLTIMGPTGSGKTTFLRALNRLNDRIPDCRHRGRLLLDGDDVYDPGTDVSALRRRVGMVFALPSPLPLSIYENVAYGPRKKGIRSRARLDRIVEKALVDAVIFDEIKDRLQASAQHLSGGQQQRLALARVLAVNPEVILLDEPTSGLDPLSTFRIEETLHQLKRDYTIILVTHDPLQAARINSDVAFLYLGKLVETGTAAQIFTRPQNQRTEDYITGKFG